MLWRRIGQNRHSAGIYWNTRYFLKHCCVRRKRCVRRPTILWCVHWSSRDLYPRLDSPTPCQHSLQYLEHRSQFVIPKISTGFRKIFLDLKESTIAFSDESVSLVVCNPLDDTGIRGVAFATSCKVNTLIAMNRPGKAEDSVV